VGFGFVVADAAPCSGFACRRGLMSNWSRTAYEQGKALGVKGLSESHAGFTCFTLEQLRQSTRRLSTSRFGQGEALPYRQGGTFLRLINRPLRARNKPRRHCRALPSQNISLPRMKCSANYGPQERGEHVHKCHQQQFPASIRHHLVKTRSNCSGLGLPFSAAISL
jgi:hypothetical protein